MGTVSASPQIQSPTTKEALLVGGLFLVFGALLVLNPLSTYSSPAMMDAYFGGETEPGSWRWEGSWSWQEEPFQFRILFHALVDAVAHLFAVVFGRSLETYWLAIVLCSSMTVSFAAVSLNYLLAQFDIDQTGRRICLAIWALLPPVHMAFVLPVQTKEDFLAYGIFHLGLLSILRGDTRAVAILAVIGALTRETLLLIPLIHLFVSRDQRFSAAVPLLLAIIVHSAIRFILGLDGYEVTRTENFQNLALPILALWLTLGFAWLPLLVGLGWNGVGESIRSSLNWFRNTSPVNQSDRITLFWLSLPLVIVALLTAHLFMARVVEIRVSFLVAPWAVLATYSWLKNRRFSPVRNLLPVAFVSLILSLELLSFGSTARVIGNSYVGPFAPSYWWAVLYVQIGFTCVLWCFRVPKQP